MHTPFCGFACNIAYYACCGNSVCTPAQFGGLQISHVQIILLNQINISVLFANECVHMDMLRQ